MSSESSGYTSYARTLNSAIERMHSERSAFIAARLRYADVPDAYFISFESAMVDLWSELRPFVNESEQVANLWQNQHIEELPLQCGRRVVESGSRSAGGRMKQNDNLKIEHADADYLIRMSHLFDEIGNMLGFTVGTGTPVELSPDPI